MSDQGSETSRRQFVKTAATAAAAFTIVPRHVLGRGFQAPSDLVNIATVGVSGMGASNTRAVMSQNIVALCDVDFDLLDTRLEAWSRPPRPAQPRPAGPPPPPTPWHDLGPSKAQVAADARFPAVDPEATLRRFVDEQIPRVKKYRDYREMLEKQKDIDAVIVATPDHMHAVDRVGGDEPRQARLRAEAALLVGARGAAPREEGEGQPEGRDADGQPASLGGQLAAAGSSTSRAVRSATSARCTSGRTGRSASGRRACRGRRGPRPIRRATPVGQPRRHATARRCDGRHERPTPCPTSSSWDLFLGVAPDVEYHPIYHPFNWRGWVDWGQGALGDMGAHLMDFPVWSLNLGLPTVIETETTPFNGVCYPTATTTYFEFPARKGIAAGEADAGTTAA